MPVITAIELDDARATRNAAGGSERRWGGLGSGADQANTLSGSYRRRDCFRELDLESTWRAEAEAEPRLLANRGNHAGMSMTENRRTIGAHVVEKFLPVGIDQT